MSYFTCPETGTRHEICGPSGAEALARLPVDPQISRLCDAGQIEAYDGAAATDLARALVERAPA